MSKKKLVADDEVKEQEPEIDEREERLTKYRQLCHYATEVITTLLLMNMTTPHTRHQRRLEITTKSLQELVERMDDVMASLSDDTERNPALYCDRCERFLTAEEQEDGKCSTCPTL